MEQPFGINLLLSCLESGTSTTPYLETVLEVIRETATRSLAVAKPLGVVGPMVPTNRGSMTSEGQLAEERALKLVNEANRLLDGGLHRCKEWGEVKDKFYHAGALFASADLHIDATEAFTHSAAICRMYGSDLEVTNALSYAIDSCKSIDPLRAIGLLGEQVELFSRNDRKLQAAKSLRDMADLYLELEMDEDALKTYLAAADAYCGDLSRTTKRKCIDWAAHLYAKLGRYKEAIIAFEQLAVETPANLLPSAFYFSEIICYLASACGDRYANNIAKAKVEFGRVQDADPSLQKGAENTLLRQVLAAFDKPSLSMMDDAFGTYFLFRPKTPWMTLMADRIRDNLYQYLLPFM